jgi:hypothetical protein
LIGSAQFARHPDVGLVFNVVHTAAHYLARAFDSSALVEPYIESGMSGGAQLLAYNIKYLIPATTAAFRDYLVAKYLGGLLIFRFDNHIQDEAGNHLLRNSEISSYYQLALIARNKPTDCDNE